MRIQLMTIQKSSNNHLSSTPFLEPEVLQSCKPHKIYSTYKLMMKRCIVDPDASDIRQTPRAATDMFYLLSVEISRTQATPLTA